MAVYETRTVHTTRKETVLPNPSNWAEVGKAIAAVQRQLEEAGKSTSDDAVTVEGRDEEIVLYWEEEEKVS